MDIIITNHARRKYTKLKCSDCKGFDNCTLDCDDKVANLDCEFLNSISEIDREIKEMFSESVEEKVSGDLVKRMINNNFESTKYYRYDIFRFVVLEKDNVLVTVERNTFTRQSRGDYIKKSELSRKKRTE